MSVSTFITSGKALLTLLPIPLQVLSDNTLVNLVPGGADKFVDYEDRTEYIKLVRNCRMSEGKGQVRTELIVPEVSLHLKFSD